MATGDSRSERLRQRKSQEHTTYRIDPADLLAMMLQATPAHPRFTEYNLNTLWVEATARYLQSQSVLLDLVAIQLSQQLIKIHGQELDQKLTSETILIHIKSFVKEIFEKNNTWSEISQEIWSNLISRAIQDMQRDLGELVLESLDLAGFNEVLFQYLFDQKSTVVTNRISYLEAFYAQTVAAKIVRDLDLTNQPLSALTKLLGLKPDHTEQSNSVNRDGLQIRQIVEEIPIEPSLSSISAQLQTDLWPVDVKSIAYTRYHAKHNQSNYLEHYITSAGDIEVLPWDAAEQIMYKFGFNTVKLQLLLAAHAVRQVSPWKSPFTLKASDIIAELGWDKNGGLDLPTKRKQVANIAYTLSCLLVKSVWSAGQPEHKMDTSTPVGRMWEVLIHPHGPLDWRTGKIEKPDEVYITVRPGLWTAYFLDQAGSKAWETLRQFSNLALKLLRLNPNDDELTLRLAIYLTLDARIRASDPHPYEYQVKPLLAAVLPEDVMQHAQESSENAGSLFDRCNNALKLLGKLGWHPEENSPQPDAKAGQTPIFYVKPYPKWLELESSSRKPRGWVDYWLEQRLILKPPLPEPEPIAMLVHSSRPEQTLQPIYTGNLTGAEVRAARQARKLTQTELAGLLQVHQSLIARIESGDRPISPVLEISLRQVLGLEVNG